MSIENCSSTHTHTHTHTHSHPLRRARISHCCQLSHLNRDCCSGPSAVCLKSLPETVPSTSPSHQSSSAIARNEHRLFYRVVLFPAFPCTRAPITLPLCLEKTLENGNSSTAPSRTLLLYRHGGLFWIYVHVCVCVCSTFPDSFTPACSKCKKKTLTVHTPER